ncbi:hypothetical protein [Streptococcus sanguinis]|jgi:hypothetical protein|uniref:hypothetical protein n=1 Tax=Streptococcus sanguinis TaxID=1305 RepID=UPI000F2A62C7|nr:MAG: hypothetical protein D8H99_40420 [Streptococcus sp.]
MSNILFIVEGGKDEPKYIDQFIQYHKEVMEQNGNDVSPIIVQSYGTLIYDLYKRISSYPEEDKFETIPVLLDILKSKSIKYSSDLEDYENFSDIFLFFDLDAHYFCYRKDRKDILYENMNDLLSFFNESTEKGKLLISYPMFEALKCFKDDFINESNVLCHLFDIYEVEKKGSRTTFKKKYKCISSDSYKNSDYSKEKIEKLVQYFILCSLYLVENATDISNSETIFIKQYEKLINPKEQVLILSAFPHFIIDIFGIERYCEIRDWTFTLKNISEYS